MTYYDSIASGYKELHREEQEKKIKKVKELITFKPNSKILDVGCGPGFFEVKNCEVIGVDPSKELLKQATIKTILGKAELLPFKDGEFDYVVSFTAAQNFEDIPKAIAEIKRVAKKNATIVITFLKNSKKKDELLTNIQKTFKTIETHEEEKDLIVVTNN